MPNKRKKTKPTNQQWVQFSKNTPKYLKYWMKQIKNLDFGQAWIAFVEAVHAHIPDIIEHAEVNAKEAKDIAWAEAFQAYMGNEESILWPEYKSFLNVLSDEKITLFLAYYAIGFDIMLGLNEKEATQAYLDWLKEDIENPIYNDLAITEDFRVVSADEYLDNWEPNR